MTALWWAEPWKSGGDDYFSQFGGLRSSVWGLEGAEVSMPTEPPVGREPEPTAVFCFIEEEAGGITPPFEFLNMVFSVRPGTDLNISRQISTPSATV